MPQNQEPKRRDPRFPLFSEAVVLLIPARTDTAYWHDHAASATVWFLRGRLRFNDGSQAAPFPSALVVWGASPEGGAALDGVVPGRRPS